MSETEIIVAGRTTDIATLAANASVKPAATVNVFDETRSSGAIIMVYDIGTQTATRTTVITTFFDSAEIIGVRACVLKNGGNQICVLESPQESQGKVYVVQIATSSMDLKVIEFTGG